MAAKLKLVELQGQDFFILEVFRFINTQFMSKIPKSYSSEIEGRIHKYFDLIINFTEQLLWRFAGKYIGRYTMMNIVGVFKKDNI